MFWKPALPALVGAFAGLLYCVVRRETDVLLAVALPILLTLALAIVIPFPAFRYQYPASLLFMLLTPLLFAGNAVLAVKESRLSEEIDRSTQVAATASASPSLRSGRH